MEKMIKAVGAITFFIVIAFASGIGKIIGGVMGELIAKNEPSHEAIKQIDLAELSSDVNKKLPVMADADTRIDNVSGAGNMLTYNATLINYDADDVPFVEFSNAVATVLHNRACTGKDTKFFLDNGITLAYAYHGKDGKPVTTFTVSPDGCKGAVNSSPPAEAAYVPIPANETTRQQNEVTHQQDNSALAQQRFIPSLQGLEAMRQQMMNTIDPNPSGQLPPQPAKPKITAEQFNAIYGPPPRKNEPVEQK